MIEHPADRPRASCRVRARTRDNKSEKRGASVKGEHRVRSTSRGGAVYGRAACASCAYAYNNVVRTTPAMFRKRDYALYYTREPETVLQDARPSINRRVYDCARTYTKVYGR